MIMRLRDYFSLLRRSHLHAPLAMRRAGDCIGKMAEERKKLVFAKIITIHRTERAMQREGNMISFYLMAIK
jgi:hypothetical protein